MKAWDRVRLFESFLPGEEVEALTQGNAYAGTLIAHVLVPHGSDAPWPTALRMRVMVGMLTEIRDANFIPEATAGRFAPEWQTVADNLAEALRVGTAEDVQSALALFDHTKAATEGTRIAESPEQES